jgi:hypothetical protein
VTRGCADFRGDAACGYWVGLEGRCQFGELAGSPDRRRVAPCSCPNVPLHTRDHTVPACAQIRDQATVPSTNRAAAVPPLERSVPIVDIQTYKAVRS